LVQRTFFAGSLSSILIICPLHLSLISSSVIIPALYLSSYSNRSLSTPALCKDNTLQVPTNKYFGCVFIHLTFNFCLWPTKCPTLSLWGCVNVMFFTRWGCQPLAQPSTWRTRVSVSVRFITFDLSGTEMLPVATLPLA
jgi:hypothetical protein